MSHIYTIDYKVFLNKFEMNDASQSSTMGGRKAFLAVDGILLPDSPDVSQCSTTEQEVAPWWRLDLKAKYDVRKIMIVNNETCCGNLFEFFCKYTRFTVRDVYIRLL